MEDRNMATRKTSIAALDSGPASITQTGGYGQDFLIGTEDKDTLSGGWGNDTLLGGGNDDKLYGNQNDDTLIGDAGRDTLYGGDGTDTLMGGADADKLYGENGDDNLMVGDATEAKGDTVDGGRGVDTLTVDFSDSTTGITFVAADPINKNSFNGLFTVQNVEKYNLALGSGKDSFVGYVLDDLVQAGKGDDTLKGMGGKDILYGQDGKDTIFGGNDADLIDGGVGDDKLYGDNGADVMLGDDGKDTMDGGADADIVAGNLGGDTIKGGDGDDFLFSHDFGDEFKGSDILTEVDTLYGGNGNDTVAMGRGDIADGQGNVDRVYLDFTESTKAENFTLTTAEIKFAAGGQIKNFESLGFFGGTADDKVTGGDLDDELYGNGGKDTLNGGKGLDILDGGAADDTLHGNDGNDVIVDSLGADKAYGDKGDDVFQVHVFDERGDVFDGGDNNDTVDFSETENLSVLLDLSKQSNNDGLIKGDTYTSIETFVGTGMDDTMRGDAAKNTFWGGEGDDQLSGGDGDDLLVGGLGSDLFSGGAGKDTFDLTNFVDFYDTEEQNNGWKGDTITDFKQGDDKIKLSMEELGIDNASQFHLVVGADPANSFNGSSLLFDTETHRLWLDMDGKGGNYDAVLIATLDNVTKLAATDFILA
jgi:Ca2+-binding RTX toxin-like protein